LTSTPSDRHYFMFNSTPHKPGVLKIALTASFILALAFSPLAVAQEHEHGAGATTKEVTGEVVDMMCYLDHGATGEKHGGCAAKCIKGGGPVGIKSEGTTYLIVGDHKPMNDQLADYAGQTVTVKGKVAERDGISMIENAEIVKK
jgi:hypothetical protein